MEGPKKPTNLLWEYLEDGTVGEDHHYMLTVRYDTYVSDRSLQQIIGFLKHASPKTLSMIESLNAVVSEERVQVYYSFNRSPTAMAFSMMRKACRAIRDCRQPAPYGNRSIKSDDMIETIAKEAGGLRYAEGSLIGSSTLREAERIKHGKKNVRLCK